MCLKDAFCFVADDITSQTDLSGDDSDQTFEDEGPSRVIALGRDFQRRLWSEGRWARLPRRLNLRPLADLRAVSLKICWVLFTSGYSWLSDLRPPRYRPACRSYLNAWILFTSGYSWSSDSRPPRYRPACRSYLNADLDLRLGIIHSFLCRRHRHIGCSLGIARYFVALKYVFSRHHGSR